MMREGATVTIAKALAILIIGAGHFFFLQFTFRSIVRYLSKSNQTDRSPIKVYVYDIPRELLERDFEMSLQTCPNSFYSVEILIPEILKESQWSVKAEQVSDAQKADYFLVPHFSSCYYHKCVAEGKEQNCQNRVTEYMAAILEHVEGSYPFWQIKNGRDHLFVLSWDWGVHLFGKMEKSVLSNRLAGSIHLTLLGVPKKDEREIFDPLKDISIPPLRDYSTLLSLKIPSERSIFAYFRGTILDDPLYGNGLRLKIKRLGESDPTRYFIRLQHNDFYWNELVNARFVLCPAGWSHWSPRLFDAIMAGAIPVIIADEWKPAFDGYFGIDYRDFTIRVPEKDIDRLTEILSNVTPQQELKMRERMEKLKMRFVYNKKIIRDDAADSLMQILAMRPVPRLNVLFSDLGGNSDAEYSADDGNDL